MQRNALAEPVDDDANEAHLTLTSRISDALTAEGTTHPTWFGPRLSREARLTAAMGAMLAGRLTTYTGAYARADWRAGPSDWYRAARVEYRIARRLLSGTSVWLAKFTNAEAAKRNAQLLELPGEVRFWTLSSKVASTAMKLFDPESYQVAQTIQEVMQRYMTDGTDADLYTRARQSVREHP